MASVTSTPSPTTCDISICTRRKKVPASALIHLSRQEGGDVPKSASGCAHPLLAPPQPQRPQSTHSQHLPPRCPRTSRRRHAPPRHRPPRPRQTRRSSEKGGGDEFPCSKQQGQQRQIKTHDLQSINGRGLLGKKKKRQRLVATPSSLSRNAPNQLPPRSQPRQCRSRRFQTRSLRYRKTSRHRRIGPPRRRPPRKRPRPRARRWAGLPPRNEREVPDDALQARRRS